jgi:hypothetical protein
MDYFLDFEISSRDGEPISVALIRQDNVAVYLGFASHTEAPVDPWVVENVIPILNAAAIPLRWRTDDEIRQDLQMFFKGDDCPHIIADWPDDIAYFCKLTLCYEPGTMIDVPGFKFSMVRIDAYPTEVIPAIRHNAFWDAMALKQKYQFPNGMTKEEASAPPKEAEVNPVPIQKRPMKFHPGTGKVTFNMETSATQFRDQYPSTEWNFNPWTGVRRGLVAVMTDRRGLSIRDGDDAK